MTAAQREALAKALADSALDEIKACRDAWAVVETSLLDLRARLVTIEHERQRKVAEVIGDE